MNIENVEKQADLIKQFKDEYKKCVLWGWCPDGDVRPDELIKWIIANRHIVALCDDIEKLNT